MSSQSLPPSTQMVISSRDTSASAISVFDRHGLVSAGFWDRGGIPTDESRPDAVASGFCRSLEELGGVYGVFARFLTWRADLLQGSFVSQLRRIRADSPAIPRSAFADLLMREFGSAARHLVAALSDAPAWNTPFRTAYSSVYRTETVIIEVAKDPIGEESFLEFEKAVRALNRPELAAVAGDAVLSQFREYVRNGESMARQRSFLEVLGHHRGETLAEYPVLIPELCSPRVLCWPAIEGSPAGELIRMGDSDAPVQIATAVLEQFFTLSIVEADLDLDMMVVDPEGRLGFRRLSNPVAVLPGVIDTGIKYLASVVAGNAPRSAQMLIRLLISQPPLDLEKQLMEEFSGVEPDLKINMWFPSAAATFESNWRALTKIAPARPLFVDCLHRNLLAIGYWNADAAGAGGDAKDAIAEGMWPAVTRLIRNELGALANRESAQEWALSSAMLMAGAFRAMNRSVEELRENDITLGVDVSDWRRPAREERRGAYPVVLAGLFGLLLASVQWGGSAPEPWGLLLKMVAIGAVAAMFWVISKVG